MKHPLVYILFLALLASFAVCANGKNLIFINCSNLPIHAGFYDNYAKTAAFGLVSNRTANTRSDLASVMATLNAGVRLSAAPTFKTPPDEAFALNGYMYDESIGKGIHIKELFSKYSQSDNISLPSADALATLNKDLNYTVEIGKFVSTLQKRQSRLDKVVTFSIYGNSDTYATRLRPMSFMLIGAENVGGDISNSCLIPDPKSVGGFKTNVKYIVDSVQNIENTDQLILIDFGDGERLGATVPSEQDLQPIYNNLAKMIDGLSEKFAETDTVILFASLNLENSALRSGIPLSPIMLLDLSATENAANRFFISNSTQRAGFIVNLDIPVYINSYFRKDVDGFAGRNIELVKAESETLPFLRAKEQQMTATYNTRTILMVAYVIYGILVSMFALFVIFSRRTIKLILTMQVLLWSIIVLPIAFYISPTFGFYTVAKAAVFAIIFSGIFSVLLSRIADVRRALFVLGAGITVIILADTVTGSFIAKSAILGYDLIGGSRFYGIGNEMCGVLMGASLLAIFAFLDLKGKVTEAITAYTVFAFFVIIIIIGLPSFGTNFGGMISMAAACGLGFYLLKDTKIWRKRSAIAFVIAALLILLLIYVNMIIGSTHIGSTFAQSLNDPYILWQSALRKWAMNFKLMRFSTWTYLITSSVVIVLLFAFKTDRAGVKLILERHAFLRKGFTAIAFGALVGFLVNDSGVVLAATCIIYMAVPIAILVGDRAKKIVTHGYYMS